MALSPEWRRRIENWRKTLRNLRYQPLGPIELRGFTTLEFLTADEALKREFIPMPPGSDWGAKWEYGWFQGELHLPAEAVGERIVVRLNPGGDGLTWVNGQMIGTHDRAHTEITLARNAVPGKRYHLLTESYAGHGKITIGGEPIPYGVETVPEPESTQTRVGESTFGIWFELLDQLWFDVQALWELREKLDENSLRQDQIDQALRDVSLIVDLELPMSELLKTAQAGRDRLQPALACVNGSTVPVFYAVGHAHLDVAWLWPLQETERKIGRTIANQLALADEYPDYVYIQSEPHVYRMLQQRYPELYTRFQAAVQRGQIVVEGGAWVEPDTNITGGESLIRQFMHGKRFCKENYGVDREIFWEPDVFGYSGALPQIILGCGLKYFFTQKIMWIYNGGDRFPYNQFLWEGIDGSQVLAHIAHGYGFETSPGALINAWNERAQKTGVASMILPFGWGDGGGGPTREHLEFARRAKNLEGVPQVKITSPLAYFRELEQQRAALPRYVGELYFQAHRGTYTSQARTKQGNRKSEIALREAELWSVVAQALKGYVPPSLDESWKLVLLNQFHDILPGSSIARVYEEAERDYAAVIAEARSVTASAQASLTGGAGGSLTLFNSLSFPRQALLPLPEGASAARDGGGKPLPVQTIAAQTYVEAGLPACGWTTITPLDWPDDGAAAPEAGTQGRVEDGAQGADQRYVLENELICARFDGRGELVSLTDKETGRELMAGPGNAFKLYRDVPGAWDAWDIDSMYKDTPVALEGEGKVELVSAGPLAAVLRVQRRIHHSALAQEIWLRRGSRRIDFVTTIDWQERHKMLKVAFPTAIFAHEAVHEIQFGHIRRPNHASRPFDADRFEVCNQKWSALVEEKRGAAVLNDSKYGVNVVGDTINLTLLRSPMAPDMRADLCVQQFTYALYTWNGSLADSAVVAQGYDLNVPVTAAVGDGGERSIFSLSDPNIVIETVKPVEAVQQDSTIVLRLYESKRSAARCILTTSLPVRKAVQTNMLEEDDHAIDIMPDGEIPLDFRPFEIKTIKLSL